MTMEQGNLIFRNVKNLNPSSNGGETVSLITEYFDNGDASRGLEAGYYVNQHIELQSYQNSTSIFLCSYMLNPRMLRQLADKLEICEAEVKKVQSFAARKVPNA